ncbi:hypothetical protein KEM60_00327 [Austwickia sp. TVS 96-490-7B]|uniref:PKD domain-containing protein n=1 Tax=Austwickia sp. TVS 96-490-7B TaxID=2830843 RepID=UPI001C56D7AA|nr:PKD domain-containing protein [Austwickia sp. TVS 96-490-7B]MBW3084143.1 hypothetical protein [Austwickia sp. TVS 96-490-7B]
MSELRRRSLRWACATSVVALTTAVTQLVPASAAQAETQPPQGVPATAGAVALPTWQITGVVWAQVVVGDTVYVTGNFTKARPPGIDAGGAGEIDVAHLMAYDIRTGERISSFSHQLNAQGLALSVSPDRKRLYVGGDFTTVDGIPRGHVAAFDVASGQLVEGFDPNVNGQVKALSATNDTLYVGGAFEGAQGQARKRLASFRTSDGTMTNWNPKADNGYVWALLVVPDASKVIAAGAFTTISGQDASGTAALHPETGELLPWAMNRKIFVSGGSSAITNLSTDGQAVYGGGYVYGQVANLEGTFAAEIGDGKLRWVGDCLGDTYSTKPLGGAVYVASHAHDCSAIEGFPDTSPRQRWEHMLALSTTSARPITRKDAYGYDFTDQQAPALLHYHPDLGIGVATGQYQASWTVDGNADYLVVGGEFPTVNGVPQQGLTRFALRPTTTAAPSFQTRPKRQINDPVATASGAVVTTRFPSAWDPDNATLRYDLVRDRGTNAETTVATSTMTTNFWTLPDGQLVDVNAPAGDHTYSVKVSDGTGQEIWSKPSAPVTVSAGNTLSGYATTVLQDGARHYWRLGESAGSTADLAGGVDAVFGSGVRTGTSGALKDDTNTAMTVDGSVNGNAKAKSVENMAGATTMEAWIRTTSTKGGRFMGVGVETKDVWNRTVVTNDRHLYLTPDGRLGVRPDGTTTQVESTKTYNNGSWVHVVATTGDNGLVLYANGEEVAKDPNYRPGGAITGRWYIGGDRTGVQTWPSRWALAGDVDEAAVYGKTLSPEQVARHAKLGIEGGAAQMPNTPPRASFTSTVDHLKVAVDASGSTDVDGKVVSYSWDFGDNTPAQSSDTAQSSHTYAAAGSYVVKLTVTDDKGATSTAQSTVTASAPVDPAAPVLADSFTRTLERGWGNAETGGAWVRDNGAGSYSVDGNKGGMSIAPRTSVGAQLGDNTGKDNDLRMRFSYDQAATGGGIFSQIIGRGTFTDGYGARLWIHENGSVRIAPIKRVARADTDLAALQVVPGLTHKAGTDYEIRVQVTGSAPTQVKVKMWVSGETEPSAWTVETTDTTDSLQKAGGIAVQTYLSGTATTPILRWLIDDVKVTTVRP